MTPAPDAAAPPGALSRPEFIALVAALMSLNALAIDIMLPALPAMGDALGVAEPNRRQLVVSAYMLGFGGAQLVYGPLSDRFGRRRPLFAGITLYVVCALAGLVAPTFEVLLAMRFVQGLGAAATRVIASSVVRDRFSGRDMAQVMSLTFMVFMVIPIVAPSVGQLILMAGAWSWIFVFMALVAMAFGVWAFVRLPETLPPEQRRPLTFSSVTAGFALVLGNRRALFYGLSQMFLFGALFGFVISSQQLFAGIYGLGRLFPVAFACVALTMSAASFLNSRLVHRFGMRRLSHGALLLYLAVAAVWFGLSLLGEVPFPLLFMLLVIIQATYGFSSSNMNSMAMEPLGAVAGTAASVFGFSQTVGGAAIGTFIGQHFDGTVTPNGAGYLGMGVLVMCCVLLAENGRLFGHQEDAAAVRGTGG